MEIFALHTLATTEENQEVWLSYRLTQDHGRYGIACWVEGTDLESHPYEAAQAEGISASLEKTEALLERLVKSQVMPAHLTDILWELE